PPRRAPQARGPSARPGSGPAYGRGWSPPRPDAGARRGPTASGTRRGRRELFHHQPWAILIGPNIIPGFYLPDDIDPTGGASGARTVDRRRRGGAATQGLGEGLDLLRRLCADGGHLRRIEALLD